MHGLQWLNAFVVCMLEPRAYIYIYSLAPSHRAQVHSHLEPRRVPPLEKVTYLLFSQRVRV